MSRTRRNTAPCASNYFSTWDLLPAITVRSLEASVFALEREIQWRCAEDHQEPETSPPRLVCGLEASVLTGLQHDFVCLPEQRVVHAESVRTSGQVVSHRFA